MKDAIAVAHGDSMHRYVQNNRNVLLSNVNLLCLSDEKEVADGIGPTNPITVDKVGGGDETNSMDQWPDYPLDILIDEYQQRVTE